MTIFVSFSDSNKTEITSVFACNQDTSFFPYQDEINESDERYKAFYTALPSDFQKTLVPPIDSATDTTASISLVS
jgi:hypothetical protein